MTHYPQLPRRLLALVALVCSLLVLPAITAVAEGGSAAVHVVAWGETLSGIAWHYGVTVEALVAANDLAEANRVYVGQKLVIPPVVAGPAITATAPSSSTTPEASPTGSATTHTVQRGETLSGIAWRYGVPLAALVAANNISNPRLIHSGQVLVIPAEALPPLSQPEAAPADVVPTTYVVQRGDNLSRIAARHNVSLAALLAANQVSRPDTIFAGMVLSIPAATVEPAPADGLAPTTSAPTPTVAEGKQIIVVLSQQRVYAFENGALLQEFLVSTGLPDTPTVQGDFTIHSKVETQRMTGPDYDLPNVPWVSYFYHDYSFHGTYWHSNFGQPMSHGCVNMSTEDAKWLYDWAPLGTAVLVMK